jgi:hypothetical protein
METDQLIHTTLFQIVCPDVVDHLREALSYHRVLGEMEPHDVAEDVTPHDDGCPLEKLPSNTIGKHGKIAHVHHRVMDLLGLDPAFGDHHHDLLFRYRDRGRPDRLFFLSVHDQIEWMIIVWTILFAGITGETIGQYLGVFSLEDLLPLFPGLLKTQIHMLAFGQAIQGFASVARFLIIYQLVHNSPSFPATFLHPERERSGIGSLIGIYMTGPCVSHSAK